MHIDDFGTAWHLMGLMLLGLLPDTATNTNQPLLFLPITYYWHNTLVPLLYCQCVLHKASIDSTSKVRVDIQVRVNTHVRVPVPLPQNPISFSCGTMSPFYAFIR